MNHVPESESDPHTAPGADGGDTPVADIVATLGERIQTLEAELEQLRAQALLEQADLDNQRKRIARDMEQARRFANERLLSDMLPVFDSLEAGLGNAQPDDPLREGLEATLRQLTKVADANGLVTVAPAPGEGFDPERHQAMSMAPAEGVAPGAVVQVFQKGYVLNERLLRPAMVMVAQG